MIERQVCTTCSLAAIISKPLISPSICTNYYVCHNPASPLYRQGIIGRVDGIEGCAEWVPSKSP